MPVCGTAREAALTIPDLDPGDAGCRISRTHQRELTRGIRDRRPNLQLGRYMPPTSGSSACSAALKVQLVQSGPCHRELCCGHGEGRGRRGRCRPLRDEEDDWRWPWWLQQLSHRRLWRWWSSSRVAPVTSADMQALPAWGHLRRATAGVPGGWAVRQTAARPLDRPPSPSHLYHRGGRCSDRYHRDDEDDYPSTVEAPHRAAPPRLTAALLPPALPPCAAWSHHDQHGE